MADVKHPAKFSDPILYVIRDTLDLFLEPGVPHRILDPFAGVGRIHELATEDYDTVGVEIEPEWAATNPRTIVGDALNLPFDDESFDVMVTSPTYGNRMADHHNAKDGSRRITYRHVLGRPLHENNSGRMQWGERYRQFHRAAWEEVMRVVKRDGLVVVNVSDHIRKGEVERVARWHRAVLGMCGVEWGVVDVEVKTPRMRMGRNGEARVSKEDVYVGRKR